MDRLCSVLKTHVLELSNFLTCQEVNSCSQVNRGNIPSQEDKLTKRQELSHYLPKGNRLAKRQEFSHYLPKGKFFALENIIVFLQYSLNLCAAHNEHDRLVMHKHGLLKGHRTAHLQSDRSI